MPVNHGGGNPFEDRTDQPIDSRGSRFVIPTTADIPPTSHAVPLTNVFREDVVRPSLGQQQALSGAPEAEDGRFRVPRILGEEA